MGPTIMGGFCLHRSSECTRPLLPPFSTPEEMGRSPSIRLTGTLRAHGHIPGELKEIQVKMTILNNKQKVLLNQTK